MKKVFKVLEAMRSIAIIALVAAIGFSMVSCDSGGDSGGGGIVGKWFLSEETAKGDSVMSDYPDLDFDSDGKVTYNMNMSSTTYTTDGDIITFNTYVELKAQYSVDGNELTFSKLQDEYYSSLALIKFDTTYYRGK